MILCNENNQIVPSGIRRCLYPWRLTALSSTFRSLAISIIPSSHYDYSWNNYSSEDDCIVIEPSLSFLNTAWELEDTL